MHAIPCWGRKPFQRWEGSFDEWGVCVTCCYHQKYPKACMPLLQAPGRVFSQYRAQVPLFPQLYTLPCWLHYSFSHLLFFKVIRCGCWHLCGLATAFPAAAVPGISAAPWMFVGTGIISTKKTSFWDMVQVSFQNGHGETQPAGLCQGEKNSLPSPMYHTNKELSLEAVRGMYNYPRN